MPAWLMMVWAEKNGNEQKMQGHIAHLSEEIGILKEWIHRSSNG
jgi:hypothetical protein